MKELYLNVAKTEKKNHTNAEAVKNLPIDEKHTSRKQAGELSGAASEWKYESHGAAADLIILFIILFILLFCYLFFHLLFMFLTFLFLSFKNVMM